MKKREVKPAQIAPGQVVHAAAIESVLLTKLHALVAHCAVTRYDDGSVRRPGWWTVRTTGSMWTVTLKEPDAAAQLIATGSCIDDALVLATMLLEAPDAPWEQDPFLLVQPRGRGGRKTS